ncbi:hypothetical protein HPB48_007225 [Haemaphysalis longicornis]|uniref:Uncharacterized protein n=1 Tax=Haemaphysalis longicornis TaxID=44386 RepID=A0A9J6FPQ6_HAELO|nr:hypothetical protein HPB48_007225 [Haemaphysalis longicornis]
MHKFRFKSEGKQTVDFDIILQQPASDHGGVTAAATLSEPVPAATPASPKHPALSSAATSVAATATVVAPTTVQAAAAAPLPPMSTVVTATSSSRPSSVPPEPRKPAVATNLEDLKLELQKLHGNTMKSNIEQGLQAIFSQNTVVTPTPVLTPAHSQPQVVAPPVVVFAEHPATVSHSLGAVVTQPLIMPGPGGGGVPVVSVPLTVHSAGQISADGASSNIPVPLAAHLPAAGSVVASPTPAAAPVPVSTTITSAPCTMQEPAPARPQAVPIAPPTSVAAVPPATTTGAGRFSRFHVTPVRDDPLLGSSTSLPATPSSSFSGTLATTTPALGAADRRHDSHVAHSADAFLVDDDYNHVGSARRRQQPRRRGRDARRVRGEHGDPDEQLGDEGTASDHHDQLCAPAGIDRCCGVGTGEPRSVPGDDGGLTKVAASTNPPLEPKPSALDLNEHMQWEPSCSPPPHSRHTLHPEPSSTRGRLSSHLFSHDSSCQTLDDPVDPLRHVPVRRRRGAPPPPRHGAHLPGARPGQDHARLLALLRLRRRPLLAVPGLPGLARRAPAPGRRAVEGARAQCATSRHRRTGRRSRTRAVNTATSPTRSSSPRRFLLSLDPPTLAKARSLSSLSPRPKEGCERCCAGGTQPRRVTAVERLAVRLAAAAAPERAAHHSGQRAAGRCTEPG